ncbi:MAG: peptide synthase [Verrucomicrobia bacterium GWC2_42_7]|nr:MAG: peptide synthase [Verrucomicrobia bacterium GWC2_42_7]
MQEIFNVSRFLELTAESTPDGCALKVPISRNDRGIVYSERSFSQLCREADATARLLQGRGVTRGMRVLLMVRPGLDLILITFALFKLGAIPVIIDPGMGLKNFLTCVARSQPKALIGISLAQWISRLFFKKFGSVKIKIPVVANEFLKEVANFSQKPFPLADTGRDELAAILFTSGSTGAPKGVCYLHGHFESQVKLLGDAYLFKPGEVDLPMLPVFALFNPAFGMTTVVPEMNPSRPASVDPSKIAQAILQCGVTNTFGSPVLWNKIANYCEGRDIVFPSIKRVLMAGAPVSPDLFRRMKKLIPNGEVFSPYGATECLPIASISGTEVIESTAPLSCVGKGTCVGKPFPGINVSIIPVEDGPVNFPQTLPPNTIGEIIAKGPVVTESYDQLPEATFLAKIEEGQSIWHRMGDVGYLDADGRLWFCGRKAERVVSHQGIFYTDCCEAVFNQHPNVYRSALINFSTPNATLPAIVVEPKPNHFPKTATQLALFSNELRLLAQKHPHTEKIQKFFFHKSFPVDVRHNAKIHRLHLGRFFSRKG